MFCPGCGKKLADNVKFCDACGFSIATANTSEPMGAPKAKSNPIFANVLNVIKGFFSNKTIKTVGISAKSNGLEWLLIFGVSFLLYAFALPLNLTALAGPLCDFGLWLLFGALLSAATFFLVSSAIFVTVKYIFKKNATMFAVFNMVATASLPLACAYLLNIISAYIWFPLVVFFSFVGLVATLILLYAGIQKFDKFETSPFWAFVIIFAIVGIVIGLLFYLFINIAFSSLLDGVAGLFGGFGSMGGSSFGGSMGSLF